MIIIKTMLRFIFLFHMQQAAAMRCVSSAISKNLSGSVARRAYILMHDSYEHYKKDEGNAAIYCLPHEVDVYKKALDRRNFAPEHAVTNPALRIISNNPALWKVLVSLSWYTYGTPCNPELYSPAYLESNTQAPKYDPIDVEKAFSFISIHNVYMEPVDESRQINEDPIAFLADAAQKNNGEFPLVQEIAIDQDIFQQTYALPAQCLSSAYIKRHNQFADRFFEQKKLISLGEYIKKITKK